MDISSGLQTFSPRAAMYDKRLSLNRKRVNLPGEVANATHSSAVSCDGKGKPVWFSMPDFSINLATSYCESVIVWAEALRQEKWG
jgi:hypothetical protein